jgi:hypothetical protein
VAEHSASEIVGLNIRAQRRALGLTQEDANHRLAGYLGREPWSAAVWPSIEKPQGGRKMRRLDTDDLAAVAAVLETTVAALFDGHAPAPATQRCSLCPSLHRWLRQEGLVPARSGEQGV